MGIFKSKKSDIAAGPDIPMDQVVAMKNQGYTNNQIIQSLQRDGYASAQIFDAISQSEMAGTVPQNAPGMDQSMDVSNSSQYGGMSQMSQMPQMQQQQMPQMQQQGPPPQFGAPQYGAPPPQFNPGPGQQFMDGGGPSTEEMIESIIDEKWNELVRDINKIIDWKQKVDLKLAGLDQGMNDLKGQFDKVHQALIGKIGDYDKHIMEVGAELQAMEKVFSKVLPSFVDNVNELNRITEKMKAPSTPPKTSKFKVKSSSEEDSE